ncbi:RusA family crossover junction endodeoxyribonuclease [Candidatus Contendibacter odensensis]|uniref:Crossover junction endodeoxyribonuclease rusA n=1 Tax=Candidatus Contendobacter odensis Run_B_J11 TaxID=1400861 RepID=A0A7U7J587_9GAMM|nr:RusA family crossover junction endodeoxyribonuclease [Candidatus Contendobacter odensis]CDH46970.1 putative Crossover junction endodeoxyribonuclease rusA [Candidatus Contendobacter odensis Run_B_J11]
MIEPLLTLTLPVPPSMNHIWRHVGGKVLLSKAARDYRKAVKAHVTGLLLVLRWKPLEGRLAVKAILYPKTAAPRDCDNVFKGIGDALTASGVWLDDAQIDCLMIERKPADKFNPRVIVEIREYPSCPF